jgi:hypothetical protein
MTVVELLAFVSPARSRAGGELAEHEEGAMPTHRFVRMISFAVAAGGVTAALVLGPAAGPAGATTSLTRSSPARSIVSTTALSGSSAAGPRTLLQRAEHAELIVRTKTGFQTIDIDRGTISSISPSSISLTRPDEVVVTATISSTTKFAGLTQAQVAMGDKAVVIQSSGTAISIRSRTPTSSSSSAPSSTGTTGS